MPEDEQTEETKKRKNPKAFRLSDDGEKLLTALSDKLGVKMTAVIELALRRMAAAEGVSIKSGGEGNG